DSILPSKPRHIAVAVSGGSDSMALTILAYNWAITNGVDFTALTVDHNLRPEARQEAETVGKWCEKYEIHHEILTYSGKIPTSNIEAIAREYRYKLLTDYVKSNSIDYLFIAHNQDEQRETFFLNLARGSGVYGLCGMPVVSERLGVKIIRPMLNFTKAEIKEFLTSISQEWIEDPSNTDTKYKRVRIRNLKELIDTLGLSNKRLIDTMNNMTRTRDAVEFFVSECIKKSIISSGSKIIIDRDELLYYPAEVVLRTLAKIIRDFSLSAYPPRLESLENLYVRIKENSLARGITLSNTKISFDKAKNIVIEPEVGRGKKTAGKI
ncbi:MAG: tRNA lysidine(34) synthetase TilS, partial [Alphaproteobacteria bacterium]|nr:tRNA lysidine(34) synthetase TilS [Alphaproteobacteria bacterium]